MNDPKEIAINVIKKWKAHRTPPRDGTAFTAIHAEDWMDLSVEFAAALQAEREDGCRRVNDAIGDRDPIIEKLKAEMERLKAERDEAQSNYESSRWCATVADNEKKGRLEAEAGWKKARAERDEAVKALEPFAKLAFYYESHFVSDPERSLAACTNGLLILEITLGHCRAARAVVEKVKQ